GLSAAPRALARPRGRPPPVARGSVALAVDPAERAGRQPCLGERGLEGDRGGDLVGPRRGGGRRRTEHVLPRTAHLPDGAEPRGDLAGQSAAEEGGELLAQPLRELRRLERDVV